MSTSMQAEMAPFERKNYFERNWKWLVPVVVLSGVLLLVMFAGGILMFVFGTMKSSEPYQLALAKARTNPDVIDALGTPIEEEWYVSGSIRWSGTRGDASLEIPIHGPKGKGRIYLDAAKRGGDWEFSELKVKAEGRKFLIDLLAAPAPSAPKS